MQRFLPLLALLGLLSLSARAENAPGERAYSSAVTVTPLLKTQTDGAGRPIIYPAGAPAEITALHVEIAPGQQTNWHKHPVPCVAYMLEGEVEIELVSGKKLVLKAGEAFAEVVDLLHNGKNPGSSPARLVLFALGTAGQPYVVKAPAPQ